MKSECKNNHNSFNEIVTMGTGHSRSYGLSVDACLDIGIFGGSKNERDLSEKVCSYSVISCVFF